MTKKETVKENKEGFENFIIKSGKKAAKLSARLRNLASKQTGITAICFESAIPEDDFYSMSNDQLIELYDLLMSGVFTSKKTEGRIKNARYSFRWYLHFKGIKHDPLRGFGNIWGVSPIIEPAIQVNSMEYKEVVMASNHGELIPVPGIRIFKDEAGNLYLKLLS